MSAKRPAGAGLVSVDDTIDDIAAKALQAAREAEDKSKREKDAGAGKVANSPKSPRTTPTPKKNLRQ